ncbi:hypothetical protein KI387_039091, partial [Taxus chinensis]
CQSSSVFVDTYAMGTISNKEILTISKETFDFRPDMIAINLDFKRGGNGRSGATVTLEGKTLTSTEI